MPTNVSLEEVRKVILSLLVARPNFTPLPVLDQDYYEADGRHIPWRKFGFCNLLEFLQSMPQYFQIAQFGGIHCVRGITEKSKHVSMLVARQRNMSKYPASRSYRSSYHPHISRPRPKIPAEKLNELLQYVKNYPSGVNINTALLVIQSQLPYIELSTYDLRDQLRELGHQLYLDGDIIRPVIRNNPTHQASTSKYCQSPLATSEPPANMSGPSNTNVAYTIPEECSDIMLDADEDGFVQPNRAHRLRQLKTDEQLISSLKEHSNYMETDNYNDHHDNQEKYNNVENTNFSVDLNVTENESNNLSNLISQRMRSRLQQLVHKYPGGIPCSELPNLYMKEFKMPLNYTELGFNNVCTFVSYLPDIFHITRFDTNDDFVVYSVSKKEQDVMIGNDDQATSKSFAQKITISKTKPIDISNSRLELYDTDDNAPFPLDLSPNMLDKFAPDDAITFNNVSLILVTDLQQDKKQFLEVYIVEVFTPSFFWIHLRKNVKPFEKFMNNLHNFYEEYQEKYTIPKLALKRDLNCACIFDGRWHRAVIKTVRPDFRVTVMFYDYGTQKTYKAENVFYLAKQFFNLPAQAIPCGLYNVKPYVGNRWKRSITDRFIERISETLLAATVISVDPQNNSMLIILTDTNEEEDVHLNDWLVQENLAQRGKMGDSVDLASSTKYVLNNAGHLPSYCFAEENPVTTTDSCSKSTTTEEFNESPKVLFEPSFACCDNYQRPQSVPPSFAPINEHVDRCNIQTSRHCVYSAFGSVTGTKTPSLFSDLTENVANSLLLDGNSKPSMANVTSDILSNDVEKQMFVQFMQENTSLQMQLTNSFRYLLKFPPGTKNACIDYTTLLFQFNNALKVLVKELNNRLTNVISNKSQNYENNAGLSSTTSHYNPNCESFVNQKAASSSKPPPGLPPPMTSSSTANSSGEYHRQYHHAAAFPTSDMKNFSYSSQYPTHAHNPYNSQFRAYPHNFEQVANQVVSAPQADTNGSCIQSTSVTSSDLDSSMFNKHGNGAKDISAVGNIESSFSDFKKSVTKNLFVDISSKSPVTNATSLPTSSNISSGDAEKQIAQLYTETLLPSTSNMTASHINTSNINPSSCHYNANEFTNAYLQHGNKYEKPIQWKETNPFIFYQNVKEQESTEQNAPNNYNMSDLASHLPSISQQSYASMMNENANARATDYNFYGTYGNTARNESNVDLVSTGHRTYRDAKPDSDGNYAPRIIYEADPVMYNVQKKPEEQQLSSQSATQLHSNIVNNDVESSSSSNRPIDISVLNDESYVTPTMQTYNSSPMTSTEEQYKPDVNINILPQHVLPEAWTNSMIQNNNSLQVYNKNSVSATMYPPINLSHKEQNYETNKELITGNSYRTAEPSRTSLTLTDDSERTMMGTCTNFWNSCLNQDQKGTTPCDYNTSLNKFFLFQQIDSVNGVTILFHMDKDGWILMHEFVEAFSKFSKSCCLVALLETTNVPMWLKEVHRYEYPVQFLQLDSYPLNIVRDSKNQITSLSLISLRTALGLLYKLKLVSREEIENAFKGNKTFVNNPVMSNMWELIIMYKDFKRRIEECSVDYGM